MAEIAHSCANRPYGRQAQSWSDAPQDKLQTCDDHKDPTGYRRSDRRWTYRKSENQ
jgi:hypothetical protein